MLLLSQCEEMADESGLVIRYLSLVERSFGHHYMCIQYYRHYILHLRPCMSFPQHTIMIIINLIFVTMVIYQFIRYFDLCIVDSKLLEGGKGCVFI